MNVMEPTKVDSEEIKELSRIAESVLIAIPHRVSEGVSAGLAGAMGTWATLGARVYPVEDSFGGFIEMTRAGIARNFLNYCSEFPKIDKLVMIDSDEMVNWDAPFSLARWDRDVVTGIVCNYNSTKGVFACLTIKDRFGVPRFPSAKYTGKLPTKGIIEINSCGTGLICIKKAVIQAIYDAGKIPFQIETATREIGLQTGVLKAGEDIAFCRQARELGFRIWADLAVHAVHYKTIGVTWPTTHFDPDMDPKSLMVDVRDHYHGDHGD